MNGIVRRFDDLGRVVIPKEIREEMGWNEGAAVSVSIISRGRYGSVILQNHEKECIFCHAPVAEDEGFMGIAVCKKCRERLGKERSGNNAVE